MFAWHTFILTAQTITSCSVTETLLKVNFPSQYRVCDDRIRHLNHLQSLIVLSTNVNNLPFRKFEFSQERRCHGSVKMTDRERATGMVQAGMIHQAVADQFNMYRISISRLMIRLRQIGRMNDRSCNGRLRVTSQCQDRHLCLVHLWNGMLTAEDTVHRTPGLPNVRISGRTVRRRLCESGPQIGRTNP